jgi:hypothetical protein
VVNVPIRAVGSGRSAVKIIAELDIPWNFVSVFQHGNVHQPRCANHWCLCTGSCTYRVSSRRSASDSSGALSEIDDHTNLSLTLPEHERTSVLNIASLLPATATPGHISHVRQLLKMSPTLDVPVISLSGSISLLQGSFCSNTCFRFRYSEDGDHPAVTRGLRDHRLLQSRRPRHHYRRDQCSI